MKIKIIFMSILTIVFAIILYNKYINIDYFEGLYDATNSMAYFHTIVGLRVDFYTWFLIYFLILFFGEIFYTIYDSNYHSKKIILYLVILSESIISGIIVFICFYFKFNLDMNIFLYILMGFNGLFVVVSSSYIREYNKKQLNLLK